MEAVRTFETSANFKVTTRRYIPDDSKHHTRRRENLKSRIMNERYPRMHFEETVATCLKAQTIERNRFDLFICSLFNDAFSVTKTI
jgi:hypothetical protein